MRFCGSVVSAGFTIMEILIAGTVVFVLLGGVMLVLANVSRQIWTRTEPRLVALTDAQRALDRVSEDLRQACLSTVSCPAGQLVFRRSPPACPGPPITYSLAGTNLTRQVGTAAPVTIATGMTGFAPACASRLVNLSLTAQVTTPQGQATQTFNSNVWVRSP